MYAERRRGKLTAIANSVANWQWPPLAMPSDTGASMPGALNSQRPSQLPRRAVMAGSHHGVQTFLAWKWNVLFKHQVLNEKDGPE